MDDTTILPIVCAAAVAGILTISAVTSSLAPEPDPSIAHAALFPAPNDLAPELRRCASLRAVGGVEEERCLAAWRDSRSRFFGKPVRPPTPLINTQANTAPGPAQVPEGGGR